jgi:hypothetical protein
VLVLELERIPGTRSIELNGHPLVTASPGKSRYEAPLENLPARNVLTLLVEVPDLAAQADPGPRDWGEISLIIRDRDPS